MQNLHIPIVHAQLNLIHMSFMLRIFSPRNKTLAPTWALSIQSMSDHIKAQPWWCICSSSRVVCGTDHSTTMVSFTIFYTLIVYTNKSLAFCATYATPLLSTSKFCLLRFQIIHCLLWTSPQSWALHSWHTIHAWLSSATTRFSHYVFY